MFEILSYNNKNQIMTSKELRNLFLKFFEDKGHKIVKASPLVSTDSSVLFTTAGMQQFKPYYSGVLDPFKDIHPFLLTPLNSLNVCSIQKCLRTSDIDEVGDESHLTFFEMLGNFSFGGYFKKEAISYAWEFVKDYLQIDLSRIEITVFNGEKEIPKDEESYKIWLELGIPQEKIIFKGREDNFWGPTGKEGPCGPTSEIYVDGVEIWNLVFNEYFQYEDKKLEKLKTKGIDTGAGLERMLKAVQKEKIETIFETDLFKPLIEEIQKQTNLSYYSSPKPYRIIADHLKGIVFLIAEGIEPSNIDRGYVLRRLIRRAQRYANYLSLKDNWYESLVLKVIEMYKEFYPEIDQAPKIISVLNEELSKFQKLLKEGLKILKKEIEKLKTQEINDQVLANLVFKMYESFGFPIELTLEELKISFKTIDEELVKNKVQEFFKIHQEISKKGATKKFGGHGIDISKVEAGDEEEIIKTKLHSATHLLHQALIDVLGNEVKQMGSDINFERARFDFSYSGKITNEEIKKIEEIVNSKIKQALPVFFKEMPKEEALKINAKAFFKEKYPEIVKVYFMGQDENSAYSKEFCGGPHVKNTKEIGNFRIIKVESIGEGIKRIRAKIF